MKDADGVTEDPAWSDERIFQLAKQHLGDGSTGKAFDLIWQTDPGYAAHCEMAKDARWSGSSVNSEQVLAFARALLAHGVGVPHHETFCEKPPTT